MGFHGAVAQVERDGNVRIGDLHKFVVGACEIVTRHIGRGETGLPIAVGTYATAPHNRGTLPEAVLRGHACTRPELWVTRAELRSAIFEYVEGFYNPTRLHSTLGMRSRPSVRPITPPATPTASRAPALARARAKSVHDLRLHTATTTTST